MPTARRAKRKKPEKLNLIPILDAIFIFIFFLLFSTSFISVFEINSLKPIVSNKPPVDKTPPLALTISIDNTGINIATGVPSVVRKRIGKLGDGKYDLETMHNFIFDLKKNHLNENSAVLIPEIDLPYEDLVKIIDSIRTLRATDESIFKKDKDGIDVKVDTLFGDIIFGNLFS
jgi:biopolymer transport protein ExbD